MGEKVFSVSTSQTFADGDKVVHGQQGEVAGVMRGRTAGGHAWSPLAVRFSGNKGHVGLRVAEVRRPLRRLRCHPRRVPHTRDAVPAPEPTRARAQVSRHPPPPLDGGFKVGEKLFYTWPSRTFEHKGTTYKLVQGQQGEVMGPATSESHKGKGVNVLFPGNTRSIECPLTEVRRLRAASAATPPPAPRTRDAAHAPCVPATASAAAPHSPHCMRSRSRRGRLPGCGRVGGRGLGAGWLLRWQRQRGRRPSPTCLLLTAGGCAFAGEP